MNFYLHLVDGFYLSPDPFSSPGHSRKTEFSLAGEGAEPLFPTLFFDI